MRYADKNDRFLVLQLCNHNKRDKQPARSSSDESFVGGIDASMFNKLRTETTTARPTKCWRLQRSLLCFCLKCFASEVQSFHNESARVVLSISENSESTAS